MVVGEQFQLPLDQQFHVVDNVGKIAWRSDGINLKVTLSVLLKLPRSHFWRSAGHVPGSTGGIQAILPLANRVAHGKKAHRHVRDHLGHLSLG